MPASHDRASMRYLHVILHTAPISSSRPAMIPCEEDKLRDILPERVEALLESLPSFVKSASVVATSNKQADDYDDPQVLRRLRDLGDIECLS